MRRLDRTVLAPRTSPIFRLRFLRSRLGFPSSTGCTFFLYLLVFLGRRTCSPSPRIFLWLLLCPSLPSQPRESPGFGFRLVPLFLYHYGSDAGTRTWTLDPVSTDFPCRGDASSDLGWYFGSILSNTGPATTSRNLYRIANSDLNLADNSICPPRLLSVPPASSTDVRLSLPGPSASRAAS